MTFWYSNYRSVVHLQIMQILRALVLVCGLACGINAKVSATIHISSLQCKTDAIAPVPVTISALAALVISSIKTRKCHVGYLWQIKSGAHSSEILASVVAIAETSSTN